MIKVKSKAKSKNNIKPEQVRDALVVTARKYRKTLGYQKDAEKRLEEFKKMLQPRLESFEKMAKQINERLASSGIVEAMKKAEEVYSRFLKSYQPEIKDAFIVPRNHNRALLTNEDVDIISEKAAEKIIEKIKAASGQNSLIKIEAPQIKLPEKTIWEDIEIKFKNIYDIEIYLKGKFLKKSNYEELGFYRKGTKDKKPDIQWQFLRTLSIFYIGKNVIKPTVENITSSLKIKRDNCMKIKENLAKQLQKAFGLKEDPFYSYKDKGEYQTRFTLKPEPELRGSGEVFITKSRYDDKKDYGDDKEYLDLI